MRNHIPTVPNLISKYPIIHSTTHAFIHISLKTSILAKTSIYFGAILKYNDTDSDGRIQDVIIILNMTLCPPVQEPMVMLYWCTGLGDNKPA